MSVIAFFFQAEDGIRDKLVTGVQTCALPICWKDPHRPLIGSLIAAQDRLRVLPAAQVTQVHERHMLQVGGELPPETVPPEPCLVREACQRLAPLPPIPHQMP